MRAARHRGGIRKSRGIVRSPGAVAAIRRRVRIIDWPIAAAIGLRLGSFAGKC
jgi:hypothetical protein